MAARLPDPSALPAELRAFMGERHLATLTTLRPDGSPHVVPVGFTVELDGKDGPTVRVITRRGSVKATNLAGGGRAAVSSVDGGRWVTLEGPARVTDDPQEVAEAVRRYAQRYRQPRENPERVAILISVDRVMGRG